MTSITILDVAKARGVEVDPDGRINMGAFWNVGLDMMGGCEVCEASIAAYNAYPSKSGYWRCRNCIEDVGFDTVEEFEKLDAESEEP